MAALATGGPEGAGFSVDLPRRRPLACHAVSGASVVQVSGMCPASRPSRSDRDCPLDTAYDRCFWHVGGTAGTNDDARACGDGSSVRMPQKGSLFRSVPSLPSCFRRKPTCTTVIPHRSQPGNRRRRPLLRCQTPAVDAQVLLGSVFERTLND
jgi:hypothetical protein